MSGKEPLLLFAPCHQSSVHKKGVLLLRRPYVCYEIQAVVISPDYIAGNRPPCVEQRSGQKARFEIHVDAEPVF